MTEVLTNRDIAILFWTTAFLLYALVKTDVHKSVISTLKQLASPKLSLPLLLSALPVALVVSVFVSNGLWNGVMTKTVVLWAIGAGFVAFLNTGTHKDGKALLTKSLKSALKFTVILEFLVNFYVFPLYIEFIFVPLITILVMLSVVAGYLKDKKRETEIVTKFFDRLLMFIGFGLISYVAVQVINAPAKLFTLQNLQELLLPIILTFSYIPSIYLLAVYSSYEQLFIRLKLQTKKNDMKLKWLWVRKAKLSLRRINELSQYIFKKVYIEEKADADRIIKSFK